LRRARVSAATRFEGNGLLALLLLAAIAQCIVAAPVLAQAAAPAERDEARFYLGADLGTLHYSDACEATALSCDHTAGAAGLFGGYRFGPRIALELGYRDLGETSATYPRVTGPIETTGAVDGYELAVLIAFPVGADAHAYLRGGAFSWRAHARTPETEISETDWSAAGGGGLAWRFRPSWEARMEYVYLDNIGGAETGETDTQLFAIGVSRFFGRRAQR
jgi:OmpA-OmpF porin, OOP family